MSSRLIATLAAILCFPSSSFALSDCIASKLSATSIVSIKPPSLSPQIELSWTLDGMLVAERSLSLEIDGTAVHGGHHQITATSQGETICSVEVDLDSVPVDHVPFIDPYPRSQVEAAKLALRRESAREVQLLHQSAEALHISDDFKRRWRINVTTT
jgi:hypothetical protein